MNPYEDGWETYGKFEFCLSCPCDYERALTVASKQPREVRRGVFALTFHRDEALDPVA